VVTTNGYTHEDDFSGAALVVDRMGEPDEPFQVQMGESHGQDFVNLELLRALHAEASG
jgi:hypothetical protein